MDLDAFFVSVERLRNKRLENIPLIIGGQNGRGVVTACSYETRKFGVHSAMPMKLANQLCPDARVISGDMEAYSFHSRLVTEIIAEHAPKFEKSSIDEFYIDVSGMDRFFGTFKWSRDLRKKIKDQTGLPISMGLSVNKLVSKVATGEFKPNGEKFVPKGHETDFLSPLPIRKIPGIGEKTTLQLNEMGVTHVKTLREIPLKLLEKAFGKSGRALWNKAHGIDQSLVQPYNEQKSMSTECTFHHDTIDVLHLETLLIAMVEKLGHKLREENKLTSCITVKIRYTNFDTLTKQKHVAYTANDRQILDTVKSLFDSLYSRRMRLRLVGVKFSDLVNGSPQISLFDDSSNQVQLNQAMDVIKSKHGPHSIIRASTLGLESRIRLDNNAFQG